MKQQNSPLSLQQPQTLYHHAAKRAVNIAYLTACLAAFRDRRCQLFISTAAVVQYHAWQHVVVPGTSPIGLITARHESEVYNASTIPLAAHGRCEKCEETREVYLGAEIGLANQL